MCVFFKIQAMPEHDSEKMAAFALHTEQIL